MNTKREINAETNGKNSIAKRLFEVMSSIAVLTAFAEEDNSDEDLEDDDSQKNSPTTNFEDLITKARKEEKAKQYKTIEKLRNQISTLTKQHNDDLIVKADLEKQIEQFKNSSNETTINDLNGKIATLTADKKALEKKVKDFESIPPIDREQLEKDIRTEVEKEFEVKTHRVEILAQHKDDLLVPELVIGTTIEELDNSLASALERSNQIREQLGKVEKSNRRTPQSPTNPSVNKIQDTEYSMDYLASLDPSSDEYKEVRKKMGLR